MSHTETVSAPARHGAASAGVAALMTVTAVMLLSLVTETEPHPPNRIPLFALAPFLGASLAIGAAAWRALNAGCGLALPLAGLFALTGLLSFGPQKFFDPAFPLIWPAVLTAQAAIAAIGYSCMTGMFRTRNDRLTSQ